MFLKGLKELSSAPVLAPSPPVVKPTISSTGIQRKNWCFTIYPDSFTNVEECYETVQAIGADSTWAIFGLETCPSTKREHLQCYCQFETRIRLTALKKKYSPTIHWETAKGTALQNFEYCSKEDKTALEFGERPQFEDAGEREKKRWQVAREAAVAGRVEDVPDQIYVQHYKSIKAIAHDHMQINENSAELENYWLWGVPGSGKSYKARTTWGVLPDIYLKGSNKWWDGYSGQETVVMEDLDPGHAYLADRIKCWADVYPFTAEVKGGTVVLRPKRIVITSNYKIEDIFPNLIDQQAIKRRFRIEHFPFAYGTVPATQPLTQDSETEPVGRDATPADRFVPSVLKRSFTLRAPPQLKRSKAINLVSDDESDSESVSSS